MRQSRQQPYVSMFGRRGITAEEVIAEGYDDITETLFKELARTRYMLTEEQKKRIRGIVMCTIANMASIITPGECIDVCVGVADALYDRHSYVDANNCVYKEDNYDRSIEAYMSDLFYDKKNKKYKPMFEEILRESCTRTFTAKNK